MLMFPLMPWDASSWPCFLSSLEFQLFHSCDCCPKEGVLGIPEMVPPLESQSWGVGKGIMILYSFTRILRLLHSHTTTQMLILRVRRAFILCITSMHADIFCSSLSIFILSHSLFWFYRHRSISIFLYRLLTKSLERPSNYLNSHSDEHFYLFVRLKYPKAIYHFADVLVDKMRGIFSLWQGIVNRGDNR